MVNLLKISEAGAIAIHTAAYLGAEPGRVATTARIARDLRVSEAHLSKVLQRLSKAGLVASARGPKGGHRLSRDVDKITLLEVYEALEGPLNTTDCMLCRPACRSNCVMGDVSTQSQCAGEEAPAGTKVSRTRARPRPRRA